MTDPNLRITFPNSLPVCEQRRNIEHLIKGHAVVIVCGETGSGKTTQLPKIALSLGYGSRGKRIGHTQPRRLAASSVAKRIAEELHTPLGEVVGYKIRFYDHVGNNTRVKLMTDGILLAETQTDPLLKAYDMLIIDEAHERSLNIDFLLGYLRDILPRRPDLKVIITSATIDAERFAKHFASISGPAPVILVSGRLYPVALHYCPFQESNDFDINDAILESIHALWPHPQVSGDILIFLPGEREIRTCLERIEGEARNSLQLRGCEVLPLFSRLSQNEQERIFKPQYARRIILATNVAETSLTVPRIKFVIDTGLARIKRYSYRAKIEQLQVENISQASANQRMGRCGRIADGICIRLYSEADFLARPLFSDPEILRSSLAGVILRMKSLHFGRVEDFPFLELPSSRAIADGYQLLQELGAMNEANELSTLGQELAQLPLDPRIARILIAGRDHGALAEMLVLTSSLSVQDVRDRPVAQQNAADKAHVKFDDAKSEFLGLLRLWEWLFQVKGAPIPSYPHAKPTDSQAKLSNKKYENLLRDQFISPRRVREWRDIHTQLQAITTERGWHINTTHATYEQLHQALLSGFIGNIGCKLEESQAGEYLGARSIKFFVHPGAHLKNKPSRWLVAAELVETSRLYARTVANIEPQWLEVSAAHLIKKQLIDPHWSKKSGEVIALERATLYGLVIYHGRKVAYGKVDPAGARSIFIRQGLVGDELESSLDFINHNRKLIKEVQDLEHKSRRQDVLVDDELIYHFYDTHLPADICNVQHLEKWYKMASKSHARLLFLSKDALMRHEATHITNHNFPAYVRLGGIDCLATYLHEPGNERDGITVKIPIYILNQVNDEPVEWLVPGMLKEKLLMLIKTLPQKIRTHLIPVNNTLDTLDDTLKKSEYFAKQNLFDALSKLIQEATGLMVSKADFRRDSLQAHHLMNFILEDANGRFLAQSRNLAQLKAQFGQEARGAFQSLAALKPNISATNTNQTVAKSKLANSLKITSKSIAVSNEKNDPISTTKVLSPKTHIKWDFGDLPELIEIKKNGQNLIGYPALIKTTNGVTLEVFDEPSTAAQKHRIGLAYLFSLQLKDSLKYLEKNIPDLQKMAFAYLQVGSIAGGKIASGTQEELRTMLIDMAIDSAFLQAPLPTSEAEFGDRLHSGKARLTLIANEIARQTQLVLQEYVTTIKKIKDNKLSTDCQQDIKSQLERLMPKDFLHTIPWKRLTHLPRYLKAIQLRIDKYKTDSSRDLMQQKELRNVEDRYYKRLIGLKGHADESMQDYRWLLEELRVSLFAQELRTPQSVSVKRLDKAWSQLIL